METTLIILASAFVVAMMIAGHGREINSVKYEKSQKRKRFFEEIVNEADPLAQAKKFDFFCKHPLCTKDDLVSIAFSLGNVPELRPIHFKVFKALESYRLNYNERRDLGSVYSELKLLKDKDFIIGFLARQPLILPSQISVAQYS